MDIRETTTAEGILVLCDVILVLIFLVGTATNSLVLLVFYRRPALRTFSNRFVINLLVTNLASCCLLFPLVLTDNLKTEWLAADALLCSVSDGIACSTCAVSIFAVVLIAVDQYCAVVDPLRYHTIINKSRSVGMIVGSWLLAALLGVLGSLNLSSRPSNPSLWQCCSSPTAGYPSLEVLQTPANSLFRSSFAIAYALLVFLAPFTAITWIYVCIYSAAHRNSKRTRQTGSGPPENHGYISVPVRSPNETMSSFHPIGILSRNRQRKLSSSMSSLQISKSPSKQAQQKLLSIEYKTKGPSLLMLPIKIITNKTIIKPGQSVSLTNLSMESPSIVPMQVSPTTNSNIAPNKSPYILSSELTHQQKLKFFLMQPNTAYQSIACRPAMVSADHSATGSVQAVNHEVQSESRRSSTSSIPCTSDILPASSCIPSVLITSVSDLQGTTRVSESGTGPCVAAPSIRPYACKTEPSTPVMPRKADRVPPQFRSRDLESAQTPRFYLGAVSPAGSVTRVRSYRSAAPLSRAASVRSTSSNIVNNLKCRISNASLFRYREETRAARISVLVIIMALVCWLPYVAVLSLQAGPVLQVPHLVSAVSLTTLSAGALISPCLFAYRSQRIQREIRKVFGLAKDPKGLGTMERYSGRGRRKLTKRSSHLTSNYSQTALELMASLAESKDLNRAAIKEPVTGGNSGLLNCIGERTRVEAEPGGLVLVDTCRSSFSSGASTQGTASSGGTVSEG